MSAHIFDQKETAFVLWRPHKTTIAPKLIIGQFQAGNPPTLAGRREINLNQVLGHTDLWHVRADQCGLIDTQVYHYWFEVTDSSPFRNGGRICCTDPTAFTVDWRLVSDLLPPPYDGNDRNPAAVVKFEGGKLVPCDAAGETFISAPRIALNKAPPNNRIVIYELPTTWTRINVHGDPQIGVGTFRDVLALVNAQAAPMNFEGIPSLQQGHSHLTELGINALELLPPADSFVEREWGYATSNYFAPDYNLGFPISNSSPTSNIDLIQLVTACHERGIRFFVDVVMAFGTRGALENVNFPDFHIDPKLSPHDPETQQSGGQGTREGFGGRLWRYASKVHGYDPVEGLTGDLYPARQLMKAYALRWLADFAIDGIRMDSVNNIANWDFVQEFKGLARETWKNKGGTDDKFIVVGEELSVPLDLLHQNRLDGLWNEDFKRMVRNVILGRNDDKESSFEWTIRKLIDCRLMGFHDGTEAVNYVGSHDVEGFRNERLYNFLDNNGIVFKEERIKLAFACLLTAVGIPMIFAGDEFADEHDLSVKHPPKQRDAVNYERVDEPFRHRIFDYVTRLIKFRTSYDALSINDTSFIHVDFNDNKRVVVWCRGRPSSDSQVVVIANFSDFITMNANHPSAEYRVHNWPSTPPGKKWREITQSRDVPAEWIGCEPIFPWEAKVYALFDI
ncbi:alpha-amylase family glycosyl hydrolase [Nitrosomonas communis]|uniref:1,4-alpha-glucan branching enzyme n=1 Tax=Nitrosomonas communis TaxID=44574 RepID=A0A1I4X962_9PROT|nr:alpha-amylase family glycosyl hydrolase [Nitrosomonas communis]SFN21779.1 1,4-alpha-glucan branching enzyme [Nitrosomonas communis]